ncbi:unnamed protein product [Euphydryas editha]|uniref:Vacuolar protein sorting-associated protein 13 DH-like domain-containing protein n=1 Tax=Euphydryas editha TaxID=104508 RepID=A0AAU9UVI3_EUPED|nr:unnamed protein product [Euphydryas editha]
MWRVRICHETESYPSFVFNARKFMPRQDPLSPEPPPAGNHKKLIVSAEQLSGILRVDSYFAPRFLPRARIALRIVAMDIHTHNDLPQIPKQSSILEGYYVSRPLMRSHRMLTLSARDTSVHCVFATSSRLLLDTCLSSDIIDSATGTMEQFIEEFRIQGTVSLCKEPRLRLRVGDVRATLLVARMCTLRALIDDWSAVYKNCIQNNPENKIDKESKCKKDAATILSGRVALWIHNGCASALRIGQEATDELIPLSAGLSLAYRWRSPGSPKKLRFSLVTPSMDWRWSTSVRFAAGTYRVRLEDTEPSRAGKGGVFLYIRVKDSGSRRDMYISGRLMLANTLRHNLLYKVRVRCSEKNVWQTICSEEMQAESVGLSVLCNLDCEAILKVKFPTHESGWSGDIPLKECRKENVPWLVKVPSEGEVSYTSVWCRVVRARSDGRIIATIWPFYVLRSHLPLDVDVLISSETVSPTDEASDPPPIVQTASGRGNTTQIIAPGTTSARHTLTFQYRNIECPVTREAVPLHYGMTETSVFDKPTTVVNIEDAVDMIQQWLQKSSRDAHSNWPYSIVTNHWPGEWQPALLQPRCDVTIRYEAVRAGGGCSLELQLSPVALLANASPIALTLRAHDATPLCRLEPGFAISPPSAVLQKPFFMSVEVGRETFVSGQLQVCKEEQGRYGQPQPGYIALEKAANFAVQCNQKVALLTMYYEIKEEINVLGITSTYMLINRLRSDVLVSAIAAPKEMENVTLRPKTFKIVQPTREGSLQGTPLCRFWMSGRWRGGDADELRAYLCLALPTTAYQADTPVPIRLGIAPIRRAVALKNEDGQSVPVVITQVKHETRWLITIAEDPCPQFVVHNRTKTTLAVAQPAKDDDNTTLVKTVQDCVGVRWCCVVESNGVTHYSTPTHCARYPPPAHAELRNPLPFLTVGHCRDEGSYEWCQPIAIADGEQLLQLSGDVTVKLRVRTHPHSTLIELQDVDQNDISASDIRRRLLGAFEEDTSQQNVSSRPEFFMNLSSNSIYEMVQGKRVSSQRGRIETGDGFSCDYKQNRRLVNPKTLGDNWSDGNEVWPERERLRCLVSSVVVTVGASSDELPLLAMHLQRVSVLVQTDARKTKTTLSVADVQIDNAQYETEQYDFAVVATTRAEVSTVDRWPALWGMFNERLPTHGTKARLYLRTCHDRWIAANRDYQELTELEVLLGPLGLYVEDAFVAAVLDLLHLAVPSTVQTSESTAIAEIYTLQNPLRLRKLLFHPLDLTLTLHTAVRMYIALDESPLRLSAFQLQDVMTSSERLTHALTVHYLSAAILGAGWVVGGLELLGAPGALAARVGNAGGGVRGVASAAAGALLRSLSSAAGSLARNLDLLAGDDEHAKRAAAARRRPPPNLMAGLVAGVTNFAINLLGAVGGLAHHPLVGVAVGESESGAAALRRGLVGAITKPLSATADLVAYAGHGLLTQTGWDPVPQPKAGTIRSLEEISIPSGWRRDCVRWGFRFAELGVLTGFEAELDGTPLQLLITHKFLVMIDAETERIYEMIDFKFCTIGPYQGNVIELYVKQKRPSRVSESRVVVDEDNEVQISAAAMARVARYTGAEGFDTNETRLLTLLPPPATAHALRAALCALLHANVDTHFTLL